VSNIKRSDFNIVETMAISNPSLVLEYDLSNLTEDEIKELIEILRSEGLLNEGDEK
jgi:hypothetical protein